MKDALVRLFVTLFVAWLGTAFYFVVGPLVDRETSAQFWLWFKAVNLYLLYKWYGDYMWKGLVWLDKWINYRLLCGRWETMSGRCHRRMAKGCSVCTWLCKRLNCIDPDHCKRAFYADRLKNPKLPWI